MRAVEDFERILVRRDIRFEKHKGEGGLIIFELTTKFPGDIPTCMYFSFDDTENSVSYSVFDIAKLQENYRLDELRKFICYINSTYRWARFSIDSENSIYATSEHLVTDEYDMSDLIFENGLQFFKVVTQVHPKIMQVIWK